MRPLSTAQADAAEESAASQALVTATRPTLYRTIAIAVTLDADAGITKGTATATG